MLPNIEYILRKPGEEVNKLVKVMLCGVAMSSIAYVSHKEWRAIYLGVHTECNRAFLIIHTEERVCFDSMCSESLTLNSNFNGCPYNNLKLSVDMPKDEFEKNLMKQGIELYEHVEK